MTEFLRPTDIVDWNHPEVLRRAQSLKLSTDPVAVARACFEWVRDEIRHSCDFQRNPVTCRASEVLRHRTGYCYAKSHLLAALLRANGLPAGFCYQRLSVNDSGPPYCLHGFNAVKLPECDWYRIDARGNRQGIAAQFTPPVEQLAFALQSPEEYEFENILADPLPRVVEVLQRCTNWREVRNSLPDVQIPECAATGLVVRRSGGADPDRSLPS